MGYYFLISIGKCIIIDNNKEYYFPTTILVSICRDLNISERVFLDYLKSHKPVIEKIRTLNLCIDGLKYDVQKNIQKYTDVYDERVRFKYSVDDLCKIFEINQGELKEMQKNSN